MKRELIERIRRNFAKNYKRFDVPAHVARVIKRGPTEKERRLDRALPDSWEKASTTYVR